MTSNVLHVSIKGSKQTVNQDFVMHASSPDRTFFLVADGASNAVRSGNYMTKFCHDLAEEWTSNNNPIDHVIIIGLIEKVHQSLIRDFIGAKGSFILLICDHNNDVGHCFYLGDCRLGIMPNSQIEWLNQPHSLAVAKGLNDEKSLCSSASRHVLYRMLRAKRFEEPAYFTFKGLSQVIVLATDGFWSNYPSVLPIPICLTTLESFIEHIESEDDASLLISIPNVNLNQYERNLF